MQQIYVLSNEETLWDIVLVFSSNILMLITIYLKYNYNLRSCLIMFLLDPDVMQDKSAYFKSDLYVDMYDMNYTN